jgi:hypothetical protein
MEQSGIHSRFLGVGQTTVVVEAGEGGVHRRVPSKEKTKKTQKTQKTQMCC